MKAVWKYKLELDPFPQGGPDAHPAGYNELSLPEGRAVHFDYIPSQSPSGSRDDGNFYMWYEVDSVATAKDESLHIKKKFMIVATGENFKFNYDHVGTCIIPKDPNRALSFTTVWHLYEKQT